MSPGDSRLVKENRMRRTRAKARDYMLACTLSHFPKAFAQFLADRLQS